MASVSHVAVSLLRAASHCRSLRPAVLPEIAGFANGVKPALRFVVSAADTQRLHTAANSLGLSARTQRVYVSKQVNGWSAIVAHPTSVSLGLIVITRGDRATRLIDAEMSNADEAGTLLGYPKCCVAGMRDLACASGQWALHLLKTADRPVDARLNRFAAEWGGLGVIGELYPCSLHCRAAARYAQSLYDSLVTLGFHQLAKTALADALASVDVSVSGRVSQATAPGSVEFFW